MGVMARPFGLNIWALSLRQAALQQTGTRLHGLQDSRAPRAVGGWRPVISRYPFVLRGISPVQSAMALELSADMSYRSVEPLPSLPRICT